MCKFNTRKKKHQPLSHFIQRPTIVPTRATLRYSLEPIQQELKEKPKIQAVKKPPKIDSQELEVHTPPMIVEQKLEMLTEPTITAEKMTENSEVPVTLSFLIPAAKTAIAKPSDTCRSVSPIRRAATNKIQSNAECQDFIDVDVGDSTTYLSWNSSLDHFDTFIRKTYGNHHLQMTEDSKELPEDKTQSPRSV